jgi:hypothetical protein
MKIQIRPVLATLVLLSTLSLQPATVFAQGTAFTYQGRLNDGINPASGTYHLRFALFDALTVGNQVGSPLTNSPVSVSNGLFTVTLDFGANFPGADRWLEIGVRTNGSGTFSTLSPRQQLTATPYAITAGAVTGPINGSSIVNGSISSAQLASGAVTAVNIASNSITANQLAAGSVGVSELASGAAAANLNAISQSGVASGGLVLSATENTALLNAGYVRIGTTTTTDSWQQRVNGTPPSARYSHTAVWTGSEMIVWGGYGGGVLNDGGRYNPAGNSWTAMPATGAPAARYNHTAVWTGSEMIVWGGSGASYLNDGGRYNPAGNSWTAMTTTGAPTARRLHTAVWTGSEMIVWGGNGGSYLNDTWSYTPGKVMFLYQRP